MIDEVNNQKYRIGVFMGGKSIEREVSFNSGRTVCDHLDSSKYIVVPIFQTEDGDLYILPWHFLHRGKIADFRVRLLVEAEKISWDTLKNFVDFIYIAAHGRFAEDGTLQGMLEVLGIPYLGTKVFGSAVGMDKVFQKKMLAAVGISVPSGFVVTPAELSLISEGFLLRAMLAVNLTFPCIVKPSHEGSSMGLSLVHTIFDLKQAIYTAAYADSRFIQDVLVEEKVEGMEFVCVSLEHPEYEQSEKGRWFSLPITEVIPEKNTDFFDYEQKYMPGRATKNTPANCSYSESAAIVATCQQVSDILQFKTISRIDGILTREGKVVIIDPNTLTGMGPATFLFHQAAQFGISHSFLINLLIKKDLFLYGLENKKDDNNQVGDAMVESKIRIGVLFGGDSNEREISLESGRNVCYKLSSARYDVIPLFVNESMDIFELSQALLIKNSTREIADAVTPAMQVLWSSLPGRIDFAFIGLHGGKGENGSVQGALEMLGIPYNGSGVLASSLCMDKYKTNEYLRSRGFTVPRSVIITKNLWDVWSNQQKIAYVELSIQDLKFPVVVKPHNDGCSVLVQRAESQYDLIEGLDAGFAKGKQEMMVEEFVKGMELTCGVYGNTNPVALPPSCAVVQKGVLSMAEKFLPGAGENQTPAPLSSDAILFVQKTLVQAYQEVGCRGYARIDCFYQSAGDSETGKEQVVILEFNTLPALTPATCLFHQAAEVGIRPADFIDILVKLGFENHQHIANNVSAIVQNTLSRDHLLV